MDPATAPRFTTRFLEELNSPYLRELTLSFNNLPPSTAYEFASFITSPRCRLKVLRLSANHFGVLGVRDLVDAMENNYSLTEVEVYANVSEGDGQDGQKIIEKAQKKRKDLQDRNKALRQQMEREALSLLRCSRILLLSRGGAVSERFPRGLSLRTLPMELLLHVLSFIAPTLSVPQRGRIFDYASTRSTLPSLIPRLFSRGCIQDPSSFPQGASSDCTAGNCMGTSGSLSCRKQAEKEEWLTQMGCDIYEASP